MSDKFSHHNNVSAATIAAPGEDRADMHARLEAAMQEVLEAIDAGETWDRDALLARYGDVREELVDCLRNLDFIQNVAPQLAEDALANPCTNASLISPQASLGDFRILRELGRGGMGVVYEAEQLSLGRRIALKVLPFAAMLDKQQLARFKNEARAAATLDHPNIVAIHSVGTERGVHYYAMQLIEGQSLAQMIAGLRKIHGVTSGGPNVTSRPTITFADNAGAPRAPAGVAMSSPPASTGEGLSEGDRADTKRDLQAAISTLPAFDSGEYYRMVAHLGIQAAEALDHAHQNGIVHRDVKPANLLLDDTGKLWVTDFGLARIDTDAGMTMTGDVLGTLRYMSPEQAFAKRAVVDHRSDIYSLGVTLYELVTLRPVFAGDDRQELLRQIAFEEPKAPRQIKGRIPVDLETIILKAIEKDPADRYATAQEIADDLRRFSKDLSIHAGRPTPLQRIRRFSRRHRFAVALIATAAALFIVLGTAYVADRRRYFEENKRFVETSLKGARTAFESNDVDEAGRRMIEAQSRIDSTQLIDADLVRVAADWKGESERYAKFLRLYKMARNSRGDEGRIAESASQALTLYEVMEKPGWLQLLKEAHFPQAHIDRIGEAVYELLLLNADQLTRWSSEWPEPTRQARRERQCQQAVECLNKAISFHAPSRGYYWLLANCALIQNDTVKEEGLRKIALETPPHDAAELFYINRDRDWGTVSKNRGYPEYAFEDNYKDHRDMLRLDPTYYNAMFFMAWRLMGQHRYAEALVGWYGCTALDPTDYSAIENRGVTHRKLGQDKEAKADFEAALAAGQNDPAMLAAVASYFAGDRSREIRDVGRAIQLAERACDITHYKDPSTLDVLALAYAENGDFESAVKYAEMAVKLCDTYKKGDYQKHLESFRQGKPLSEE